MRRFSRLIKLLIPGVLICSTGVQAAVYKCVDADGAITYSQVPCPDNPETVNVGGSSTAQAAEEVDCRYANRFAYETATSMRGGASSSDIFDRYGGLDSLSKGTINLINYVYGFRSDNSVSAQRIAGLTQTMCQARTLRNVSCEDLPLSFTDSAGGCDDEEEEQDSDMVPSKPAPIASQIGPTELPRQAEAETAADDAASRCKENYQNQIYQIDQQMRSGYSSSQGESLRERRRSLRDQMRRC